MDNATTSSGARTGLHRLTRETTLGDAKTLLTMNTLLRESSIIPGLCRRMTVAHAEGGHARARLHEMRGVGG
jgi:hypothetical protein